MIKKGRFGKQMGMIAATVATASTFAFCTAYADTVTVQPGDTLWSISEYLHTPLQTIESQNPSVNPSHITPGMVLQVSTGTSASNLYWLEHIIHAEAGGESLQAKVAVGNVIMNRLEAGGYGNTIQEVVCQVTNGYYQFTSVQNGYVYSAPDARSIQAAQLALKGNDNEVPAALVFYNPAQTPSNSWVWSQPTLATYGHLDFAR
jgi:N-acetylmuramoyl-L-alanine amidase